MGNCKNCNQIKANQIIYTGGTLNNLGVKAYMPLDTILSRIDSSLGEPSAKSNSEINDNRVSTGSTFSSQKIQNLLSNKANSSHTHPATDITQDATHRFVSDTQITAWNNGTLHLDQSPVSGNTATAISSDGVYNALGSKVSITTTINGKALSSSITLAKSDIGLSLVPNIDTTNPVNIIQNSTHRFVTDDQITAWNSGTGGGEMAVILDTTPISGNITHSVSSDGLFTTLQSKVSTSTAINGKSLGGDITITKSDIGLPNVINVDTSTTTNITEGTKLFFTSARAAAASPIQSISGRTGVIVLTKTDVGLSNVANIDTSTSTNITEGTKLFYTTARVQADSPVKSVAGRTGIIVITKTDVGLANVPNTDATNPANIATDTTHRFTTDTQITTWNSKQDALVSGTSIKTINGNSLLGSGDIIITGGSGGAVIDDATPTTSTVYSSSKTTTLFSSKVDTTLTINTHALSGNITLVKGDIGLGSVPNIDTSVAANINQDTTHRFTTDTQISTWNGKQDTLVSGTTIKTINGTSLLGSGDIVISGSGGGAAINDSASSTTTVYSSSKVVTLLNGKANTVHTHTPADIVTDTTHRFVTDVQVNQWNTAGASDYWVSVKASGAVGDGTTDDTTSFQNSLGSNRIVYLPSGTYKITTAINLSSLVNLKILGTKNSKITSSAMRTLMNLTNCNGIEFRDVIFETTVSDAGTTPDTTNGLLKITGGNNIRIANNTFNAAGAITNGIRVIVDDTHGVSNMHIEGNSFDGIGQRGIEIGSSAFSNSNFNDSTICDNYFNNTGSKIIANGQAILIQAYSRRIKVDNNEVKDANGAGMQFDGIEGLSLVGNGIYSITRDFKPLTISNAVTGRTIFNLTMTDSIINVSGSGDHTITLQNINTFVVNDNNLDAGAINIKGSSGSFKNNHVKSDGQRAVYIQSASDKIHASGNFLDNTFNSIPLEPVLMDGPGVTNVMFNDNRWYSATGNSGASITSGGTNNFFINVWGA